MSEDVEADELGFVHRFGESLQKLDSVLAAADGLVVAIGPFGATGACPDPHALLEGEPDRRSRTCPSMGANNWSLCPTVLISAILPAKPVPSLDTRGGMSAPLREARCRRRCGPLTCPTAADRPRRKGPNTLRGRVVWRLKWSSERRWGQGAFGSAEGAGADPDGPMAVTPS